MFRKMRRFKQQITDEECRKILAEEGRGVLSLFGEDGYPYGIPMNYFYDEDENKIYFHCAKEGHKIDALQANGKVSFCVLAKGTYSEGDWACTASSYSVRFTLFPTRRRPLRNCAAWESSTIRPGKKALKLPRQMPPAHRFWNWTSTTSPANGFMRNKK